MTRVAAILVLAAALAGCGDGADTGSDDHTAVAAAFYPLAWVAERVAGEGVEVIDLTPPGVEPHDLELSARDVERVREADLVLYLGGGFMPALEEALAGRENAIDLLEGVGLLESADGPDPHVWLDPVRLADITRAIAEALGDLSAAAPVVADLTELDTELRAGLADCERREIVTSHAAFGYLAEAYDLEQIALTGISPEAEPGPRALEELVEEVRVHAATTVFFETLVSPRLAKTVARETGAATAALDPLEGLSEDALGRGEDYLSVMRANLETLRTALACR